MLHCASLLRTFSALCERARPGRNRFSRRLSSPDKRTVIYLNKHGEPFIPFFFKEIEKKHVRQQIDYLERVTRGDKIMTSRIRTRVRFTSISSDATSICHETSTKLFLVIDKLYLVHCFKIFFRYVLPVPTESSVN